MQRPRSLPVLVLALLTATLAVAGLVAAAAVGPVPQRHPDAPAAPASAVARSTTAPAPPTTTTTAVAVDAAAARLAGRLDAVLAGTDSCVTVQSAAGVVYRRTSSALVPASTQKLLVGAAALDVLGPHFRFATSVVATGPPDGSGTVGDLWLVGGGDPVLSSPGRTAYVGAQPDTAGAPTTPLAELAAQLAAGGVREVRGSLHGDDSRYERLRWLPSWKPIYFEEADVAPLGALEVDDGLQRWDPDRLAPEPATHAAEVLASLAGARRIAVRAGPDGVAPAGATVLASIQSPPLSELVAAMLRSSHNLTAELLVRELDRARGGNGTTAGGVAVIRDEAAKLGLPVNGVRLVDGSGLSPDDRATCEVLVGVLALADRQPFTPLAAGLSVAGRNGTLVHRFAGTPAEGHLFAKTGSIEGVAGLAGVLDERQPLRFAFLVNHTSGYVAGTTLEDRVVAALGTYPEP